ncbi:MAG TPA: alpha/beta hydrolase [Candidatus Saccharimonadia bacterium]|nr:alpha/beta hydrolase [Candidatus Saccharimonadia bacterium]
MFSLAQVTTADNLILSGLFREGDKKKPLVIHIHGFEGDFYTHKFVHTIDTALAEENIGLVSIQTRGTASDNLFKLANGDWKRYGAHFELHEDAHKDIDAWIEFAKKQGYSGVILHGHSLGTMKSVRYLFEGKYPEFVKKLVLLAPFDNIYMAKSYTTKKWRENLMIAKAKVIEGKGEEIMPKEFWDIELSYQTYVTWLDDNDLTHMFDFHDKNCAFPILRQIKIPVFVAAGSKDTFFHGSNPKHMDEAIEILRKNINTFEGHLIEGSEHSFIGFEDQVSKLVQAFVK